MALPPDAPTRCAWSPSLSGVASSVAGGTLSRFIATLGSGEGPLLDAARPAIFGASLVAGTSGYLVLRRVQ